jgi:septal ring factor EnvC (AmiA/AmiB activator)
MTKMEPNVVIAIITLLAAPVAAVVGYRLNKKKTDTDISNSIAMASGDAVEAMQQVMKSLHDELKETKEDLAVFKAQNKNLEESLEELKKQNGKLMEQNFTLAAEILELRKLVEYMKAKVNPGELQ